MPAAAYCWTAERYGPICPSCTRNAAPPFDAKFGKALSLLASGRGFSASGENCAAEATLLDANYAALMGCRFSASHFSTDATGHAVTRSESFTGAGNFRS